MRVKAAVRRMVRAFGYEIRRLDPDLTIDTYLWYLFPHFGINTVLDVGARCGEFGTVLRNNNYRGNIISFEPVSANFGRLEALCARDPGWTAYQYALGAVDATAEINVARETRFTSFREPTRNGRDSFPGIERAAKETVTLHRLDGLFDTVTAHIPEPRVYLKIDTQGWDLEVLEGASGCLDQIDCLQTEVSLSPLYEGTPLFDETLRAFGDTGFEVAALFPVARINGWSLAELDCVMVRR